MAADETFDVRGMYCTGCEDRLRTVLGRLEGVGKADADYRAGQVRVRYDAERIAGVEIKERLRAAGYEVD